MGKVIGQLALVAGALALAATGIGAIGSAGLFVAASTATYATLGVSLTAFATIASIGAVGLTLAGSLIGSKVPAATLDRLTLSFDPNTPRKMAFGAGPLATDVIYYEPSGTNQEYEDYIVANAAHRITSCDMIYSSGALMWTAAGGVQGVYAGFLTVGVVLEGNAANAVPINGGTTWTSACTVTGCAYLHFRCKRSANGSTSSPFVSGLPSGMVIIGKGMPLYDPRRDATAGGAGTHRATDQSTWQYVADDGTELGQNHALQALAAKLGWKIGGLDSVGAGMPRARVDLNDYITAANICDEAVALAGGGTQRRYEGGGVFADTDRPATILASLCTHMNAVLRDSGGKLGLRIAVNDLSGVLPAFTDADVLGAFTWNQFASLTDTPSEVRGSFVDPSPASLYQLAPYTTESVVPPDGIRRTTPLDLGLCHDAVRAQRIARRVLLRGLVKGQFTADFGPRAWAVAVGQPLTLTFGPARLAAVKFRVVSQQLKVVLTDADAVAFCPLTLQLEDPSIYVEDGSYVAPAAAVAGPIYLATNDPLVVAASAAMATSASLIISQSYTAGFGTIALAVVGSSVTASIPAHSRVYTDKTVAVNATTVTGLAFATTYSFYYDDAARAGGAVTVVATTVAADAFLSSAHPARHYLGYATTPASGGTGGSSGGGGSPPGHGGGPIP